MLTEKGQTLLEVTVAIGLAVVILGALTILTITSLRNSQFAQNQTNATKLAQEGLEEIRSMRDRNQDGSVCLISSGFNHYNWTELWGYSCGSNCTFRLQSSGFCSLNSGSFPAVASPYLQSIPPGTAEVINNKFTRKITIANYGSNQKKVTSQVSWNDSSGQHQTTLVTILANY